MTTVLPALSSLGIVGFALVSGSVLYVVLGIGLSVLGVGAAVAARAGANRARRRRQDGLRRRYEDHLDDRHAMLAALAVAQRESIELTHPDPGNWPAVIDSDRLWERRPGDGDFMSLRLGRGRVPLATPLRLEPAAPATDEEPDLREEADLLVVLHSHVDDVPITTSLWQRCSLAVQGPPAYSRPLLRAIVLGLALTHAPGELRLVDALDESESAWLAELPHTVRVVPPDGDLAEVSQLVSRGPESGALVLVLDVDRLSGADERRVLDRLMSSADGRLRLLLVDHAMLPLPSTTAVLATLDADGGLQLRFADGSPTRYVARPDGMSLAAATTVARELSAVRMQSTAMRPTAGPVRLAELLDDAAAKPVKPALSVPLGRDEFGKPLELDLAEAARGGAGPHGLLVGATGSGKSELLRAVITGLVHRRSPDELALLCWDFKGGAAVAPFAGLPHVRGTLTNLETDPRLLDRAGRALRAEVARRQQLLGDAGVDSVDDLSNSGRSTAGAAESPGPVLPTLLLVVDEFSELLAAAPDLLDLFVSLGRLGRSLGIHLLLASQRFDEGRLRGLESHLRYRICLRTFSPADSQTVLGTDAAFRLPSTPGSGLLAIDGQVTRFDGAFADDLDRLVAAATERWRHVRPRDADLWPADLPATLAADLPGWPASGLRPVLGLVDLPERQAQEPFSVDLTATHVAVVGAGRSGRTTLLATLLMAVAAGASAGSVAVYVITDDVDAFAALAELPHVAGVCAVDDEEQVRHILTALGERTRTRSEDRCSERVLLLLDGWPRLRQVADELVDLLGHLAATGLRHGTSLVLTGNGWADFRTGIREYLGTRWELRLADPYESEHGRRSAAALPPLPGRLLTQQGAEAQIALPRPDGVASTEGLIEAQHTFVRDIQTRGDTPVPKLRPVPHQVALDELSPVPGAVLLGAAAGAVAVRLDLIRSDRHLVVVGESGAGRSTTLRTLLTQLVRLPPSGRPDIAVIDPRRSLLPAVAGPVNYAYTPNSAARLVGELAARLENRRPADDLSRDELLIRSKRPPAERPQVLVVDDYDLLAGTGLSGPLGPLVELLPFAVEIGLCLVVARAASPRLGYDPGWQGLIDAGATALLLSADPSDGPVLRGIRPVSRPPGRGLLIRPRRVPALVQVADADADVVADLTALPETRRLRSA